VGTVVTITGVSLRQTKAVTFGGVNGVKATAFSVISDTEVLAAVPTGAKSGDIVITNCGGNCCNRVFRRDTVMLSDCF
jgi:hypothetical protein